MNVENRSIPVPVNGHPAAEEPAPLPFPPTEESPESRPCYTPLIDIHEGAEGLILEADLPGATEDQVQIQLEDNVLTLHARVATTPSDSVRLLHEEYRLGDFHRSFILSDEVDRTRISAELKNGVLRLVLPRAERAQTRRIEIKS